MKFKSTIFHAFIYIILVIGILLILFPIYLTAVTAFKSAEMTAQNFFNLPPRLYLDNFKTVFSNSRFPVYFFNSVIVTVISVGIIAVFIPAVSYSIARKFNKLYYRLLYYAIVGGIFVPFQVIMIPEVKLVSSLHMLSRAGIIVLYVSFALAGNVFLMVGYLKTVPLELEESAFMDGCSVFKTYVRIIYPLIQPMTATIVILACLWIWNDFLLPLVILYKSDKVWTLPLFQYNFRSQYTFDYNLAFASFFASIIPITILYAFMQKYIISGLTQGAIKS